MDKLSETIMDLNYIAESLRVLKLINDSGSCNDCANKDNCLYVPNPGQLVRYNCFFYARKLPTFPGKEEKE